MSAELQAAGLSAKYQRRHRLVLDCVDLTVTAGESMAIVGESGSGKTTLARSLAGLLAPDAGSVTLAGQSLWTPQGRWLGGRRIQYVPQDASASLDPRMRVGDSVAEAADPRRPRHRDARASAVELLSLVGLSMKTFERYPHELSGGQRQRVAIARALAVEPQVLVADEITSALDSTVQAGILELLSDIRARMQLTLVFISHDLAVVSHLCDSTTVLFRGRIVEVGRTGELLAAPRHPYTRLLLDSIPGRGARQRLGGVAESMLSDDGCVFEPRCRARDPQRPTETCHLARPALRTIGGTAAACHAPLERPTDSTKGEKESR